MPDAVVIKVEKKAEKNALIHFDVGQVAWSPDFEVASKLLIGKPLPSDWTVRAGEFGPQALPPRPKGTAPQAAWRNTRDGFLAEAEGRLRWQQVEEERRDRRTALMQAVADANQHWRLLADEMYAWLRQTSGAPSSASAAFSFPSAGGAPEPTSVGGAAQTRETVSPPKVPGGSSAPADLTSGTGAGEAGAAPEGYGEGSDGAVPSTTDLATEEDWQTATKNGLTTAKAKAIAKGLGITVTSAVDLTRADFSRVINKYLEMQAAKK